MALPTRGQPDWDDELNNEIQRLDGDVQSAKADATSAKSTAISAQNSASAAANSAAQSAASAQVAANSANKPTADAMDAVLADSGSAASRRLSATYAPSATQRMMRKAGVLLDGMDDAGTWDKHVRPGTTVTASTTRDPQVGDYLTFSYAGTNGSLYRAGRDVNLDMRGKFLSFWVRFPDANVSNFRVLIGSHDFARTYRAEYFGGTVSASVLTPGVWHRLTLNLSRPYSRVGFTEDSIADVRNIAFFTFGNGNPSSFDVADLRIHDAGALDRKVLFQFDDASIETYTNAYPILSAAGYVGSIPVSVDDVENGTPGFMSVAQLQEVYAEGWETAGHHSQQFPAMTDAAAVTEFQRVTNFLRSNGLHRGANYFIWPGGQWDDAKQRLALDYFSNLRRVDQWSTETTPWVADPRNFGFLYVTTSYTPEYLMELLDEVAAYGGCMTFVFHRIVDSGATAENYNKADFQQVVDHAASLGFDSTTMTELWGDGTL